eukprot:8411843-Pyramimonas_sp.AAC.1
MDRLARVGGGGLTSSLRVRGWMEVSVPGCYAWGQRVGAMRGGGAILWGDSFGQCAWAMHVGGARGQPMGAFHNAWGQFTGATLLSRTWGQSTRARRGANFGGD